jgi:hypothetical protein
LTAEIVHGLRTVSDSYKSNGMVRLIKNAGFAISTACIEEYQILPRPKVRQTRLTACNLLQEYLNIIIPGEQTVAKPSSPVLRNGCSSNTGACLFYRVVNVFIY